MELEFDIKRALILSEYIDCWAMPDSRAKITKGKDTIELYSFPCDQNEYVSRFATIGLSSCKVNDTEFCNSELMLVVPKDVALEQSELLTNYIFDIVTYLTSTLGRNVQAEDAIPESELAPKGWPKAILFDEPHGEPETLGCFHVGAQAVKLLWLVPIFGSEYNYLKTHGISALDKALESIELSPVDIRRKASV